MTDTATAGHGAPGTKLVIFDLDGVLVDTQDAENGGLMHLAALMGVRLDQRTARELFSGKRMGDSFDIIESLARRLCPVDAMAIVRAKCEDLIGDRLEPIDGVTEALARLPLPMCVASNSPLEIIERRVRSAGIDGWFGGRLYSAYEVDAWKPDPRLFRFAADACGVASEDCLVIEDSQVGVQAALAAGMPVLRFVQDLSTPPVPEGAAALGLDGVPTFSSMWTLPELLATPAARPSGRGTS
jgi:HAD superfamily hydrolase (TIGR01509 family)